MNNELLDIEYLNMMIKDYEEAIIASSDILNKDTLFQFLVKRHMGSGLCNYIRRELRVYRNIKYFIELCFDEAEKLGLVARIDWYMCDAPCDCYDIRDAREALENRVKVMKRVKELYYGEHIN